VLKCSQHKTGDDWNFPFVNTVAKDSKTASKTWPNTGKTVVRFSWPERRAVNEAVATHTMVDDKLASLVVLAVSKKHMRQ